MPAPSAASSDPDIEAPDGRLAESESLAIRESEIASEPTTEPPAEKQAVVADLDYWHAALVVVTPGSHADLFKAAAIRTIRPRPICAMVFGSGTSGDCPARQVAPDPIRVLPWPRCRWQVRPFRTPASARVTKRAADRGEWHGHGHDRGRTAGNLPGHTRPMLNTSNVSRMLDAISDAVAIELASTGWQRRVLGRPFGMESFTCDLENGVLATMNLISPWISIGTEWPQRLSVDIGVDFESALSLTPLLTLPAMPMLVRAPTPDGRHAGDGDGRGRSSRSAGGGGPRDRYQCTRLKPLRSPVGSMPPRLRPHCVAASMPTAVSGGTSGTIAMLIALGRRDEVHDALVTYEQRFAGEPDAARARRFARQVRRRTTDLPALIRPLEDTLAVLPAAATVA